MRESVSEEVKELFNRWIDQSTAQQVAILDNYRANVREAVAVLGDKAFTGAWLAYRAILGVQQGLTPQQAGPLAAILDTLDTPPVNLDDFDLLAVDRRMGRRLKLRRFFRAESRVFPYVVMLLYVAAVVMVALNTPTTLIIGCAMLAASFGLVVLSIRLRRRRA